MIDVSVSLFLVILIYLFNLHLYLLILICLLGDSKYHFKCKRNFENILNRTKNISNHQDEWYVYHSDLSWYVSDCTVKQNKHIFFTKGLVRFMVFNATFNNISDISWQSVFLVEETRVPRENHWPVASHCLHKRNKDIIWSLPYNLFSIRSLVFKKIGEIFKNSNTHCIKSLNREQKCWINKQNFF